VVAATILAVGVGVLDWHRRGSPVAVVAVSLWLVTSVGLAVVSIRPEARCRRGLCFAVYAVQNAVWFWAILIGIQSAPIVEEAVVACLFGATTGAFFASKASGGPRRDRFVTVPSAGGPRFRPFGRGSRPIR
jgi:hypothetical membrane protein